MCMSALTIAMAVAQVRMDAQGMDPDHLDQQLQEAGPSPDTGRPPRLVYIIPTGHNPTGVTMTLERKQRVYEVGGAQSGRVLVGGGAAPGHLSDCHIEVVGCIMVLVEGGELYSGIHYIAAC